MIGRPFSPSLLGSARRASLFVILLLAQTLVLVKPDIIDLGLNMLIDASSDEVHFVKGNLRAPASIDLSHVRWITNEELVFDFDEGDYEDVWGDDNFGDDNFGDDDAESTPAPILPYVAIEPEDNNEDNESINIEDNEHETGIDVPEVEKEVPEDPILPTGKEIPEDPILPSENEVEEEKEEEDVDSESTSETPESDVVVGDEEDLAPTEGEDDAEGGIVEDEKPEDIDAEVVENESDSDEAIEENVDDEQKSESVPEEDAIDEDAAGEPVDEETTTETEDVAEEPLPEENDVGNDEEAKVEDDEDVVDEKEMAEEEISPETPPEDTKEEGVDEIKETENIEDFDEDEEVFENGGNRTLEFTGSHSVTDQIMDIVVFEVPKDCKMDSSGSCDWVALGIGAYDNEMVGEISYCCSRDTAGRKICDSSQIGRMMINHNIFDGDHRTISVPNSPLQDFEMDDPIFEVEKSGEYILVIANCNDDGFGVISLGSMEWKSVGGYLPGDIYHFMFFLAATSGIYLVIGVWYYFGMQTYQDGAIPIQKYILTSIILGFLGNTFKSIDFLYWNIVGHRSDIIMYIGISFGILFQGSLRCLGVMVAMGWGVVRDSLGMTLCKIIILGLMYAGASLLREMFEAAARPTYLMSSTEQEELVDLVLILSLVVFVINIIFYVWILKALGRTTEYLKNMNQTSKLRRHVRLRCLIITSLVLIAVLTVVNATQTVARILPAIVPDPQLKPFLTVDQEWILKAVAFLNHLFIIFGVAILWRPNPDAKDYAMQMQIPSGPDDENDLELSCVVPSADDMDTGEGYKIESAIST